MWDMLKANTDGIPEEGNTEAKPEDESSEDGGAAPAEGTTTNEAPVEEKPAEPVAEQTPKTETQMTQPEEAPVEQVAETPVEQQPTEFPPEETPAVEEEPVLENPVAGIGTDEDGPFGLSEESVPEDDQKPLLGDDTQVPEMVLPQALQNQQASASSDIFAAPAEMPTADTVVTPVEQTTTQSVNQIEVLDM